MTLRFLQKKKSFQHEVSWVCWKDLNSCHLLMFTLLETLVCIISCYLHNDLWSFVNQCQTLVSEKVDLPVSNISGCEIFQLIQRKSLFWFLSSSIQISKREAHTRDTSFEARFQVVSEPTSKKEKHDLSADRIDQYVVSSTDSQVLHRHVSAKQSIENHCHQTTLFLEEINDYLDPVW